MKETGIFLICIAAIVGYFAFNMDTSVSVGGYSSNIGSDKVVNLGRLNDQQNLFIVGSALGIMGCVLLVGGVLGSKLIKPELVTSGNNQKLTSDKSDDSLLTPKQKELKAKYERSEISLEDYTKEWNKL
ncbi:MAG: hypothetical protein ACJ75B_06780 [Flavisolibacter sp.]